MARYSNYSVLVLAAVFPAVDQQKDAERAGQRGEKGFALIIVGMWGGLAYIFIKCLID